MIPSQSTKLKIRKEMPLFTLDEGSVENNLDARGTGHSRGVSQEELLPYVHLSIPLWARAVTGGVVSLVVAIGVFVQVAWRSDPGTIPLVPALALEIVFMTLAVSLFTYGLKARQRTV